MGFAGGAEIRIDPQMDAQRATFEPAPAAPGQFGRLGNFPKTKQQSVKIPSRSFTARRHRQLDMIDADQRHGGPRFPYFALLVLFASIAGALGPTHRFMSTVLETL